MEYIAASPNATSTMNAFDADVCAFADILENPANSLFAGASRANIAAEAASEARAAGCTEAAVEALSGYRFVDEIHELGMGRYVRWARRFAGAARLTAGGVVVDVRFGDAGITVTVRGARGRVFRYRFDECATFQKLSRDEAWILEVAAALLLPPTERADSDAERDTT